MKLHILPARLSYPSLATHDPHKQCSVKEGEHVLALWGCPTPDVHLHFVFFLYCGHSWCDSANIFGSLKNIFMLSWQPAVSH